MYVSRIGSYADGKLNPLGAQKIGVIVRPAPHDGSAVVEERRLAAGAHLRLGGVASERDRVREPSRRLAARRPTGKHGAPADRRDGQDDAQRERRSDRATQLETGGMTGHGSLQPACAVTTVLAPTSPMVHEGFLGL